MRAERRRTRDSLTKTLSRIAGRIAVRPTGDVEWTDHRTGDRERATVTAKCLWVAGSYARGAVECGDLDLILDATIDGFHPPARSIAKSLFGATQDTSLYIGTPESNSSQVAFPEARLVWCDESPDWRLNIAAIGIDPEAGRFARATDELPLRPDQLSTGLESLEELVELRRRGVLVWEFIDANEIGSHPAALDRVRLPPDLYGAKTREAVQLAVSHFASAGHTRRWKPLQWPDRTRFRSGGKLVFTGQLTIALDHLESPVIDTLALVPHRSRRGPNGIWLIRRGPEHPVERLFAGCRAFHVTNGGEPIYVHYGDGSEAPVGIDLFSDEEGAAEGAEIQRDFEEEDDQVEVASAAGAELLLLIAGCDLVKVDGTSFVFSRAGQGVAPDGETGISDARELAAALGAEERSVRPPHA